MPLKKFFKRVFNTEIQFQVLKSQSSVELSCYTKKQRPVYSHLRKFSSYYDTFESAGNKQVTDDNTDVECSCETDETDNRLVTFWHVENSTHNSNTTIDKNCQMIDNVFPSSKLTEQHRILNMFENLYESSTFNRTVVLKSVESGSLHPMIFLNVRNEVPTALTNYKIDPLLHFLENELNYKILQGTYKQLHSLKCSNVVQHNEDNYQSHTGYLIFSYKILNFDAIEQLESQWTQWSGANYLYKCSPRSWNLKKLTFYKLTTPPKFGNFIYILLCEFENLMQPENLPIVCETVERLKLRGCGHVGVYKVQKCFTKNLTNVNDLEKLLASKSLVNNNDLNENQSEIESLSSSKWSSQETFKTSISCT